MHRKWTKVLVLTLICLVAIAQASCAFGYQRGTNMKTVGELLRENGYEPSDTSWLEVLTDEQQSAIRDAYETDRSAGYEGSQGDWMAEQLHCRVDQNKEVAVVMPDGTEFTVSPSDYFYGGSNGASSESNSAGDSVDAKNGLPSPREEWQPLLTPEQNAAIDISYEASVASGYEGTRDEWLSKEVSAHYNRSGDIVVSMPSGEDFTVVRNDGNSSAPKPSEQQAAKGENGETGSAAGAALVVDGQKAKAGATGIPVTVRVERNPGILGMALSVSFDSEALVLRDAESGEAVKSVLTMSHSKDLQSGCVFAWDGVEVVGENVRDGAVLTLYFDVLPGAKPGTYPVAVSCEGSVVDNNLQEVNVSVRDGSVVVE